MKKQTTTITFDENRNPVDPESNDAKFIEVVRTEGKRIISSMFITLENTKSATADTFEGKEGVWRTVRGTPIFFPEGEDGKDVIDKAFKSPTKPSPKSEQEKDVVRFPEARKKHQEFRKGKEGESYSFDPVTNKGYNAMNPDEGKDMYKRYGNGSDPVYFISETNHQGQLSRESESAYINIQNRKQDPIVGRWISDETGFDYTDVSYAKSSGSPDEIKGILQKTNQESAMVLNKDGTVDFINA
jgi:hypothetical protein